MGYIPLYKMQKYKTPGKNLDDLGYNAKDTIH